MTDTARTMSQLSGQRIGLGCAQLGDLFQPLSDEAAEAVVEAAWQCGIRYFDTAPHYGLGLSEQRLGRALRGTPRSDFIVSTKVGRLIRPQVGRHTDVRGSHAAQYKREWDFSRDGVLRSLDESLERLDIDHVDIVLMHDVGDRFGDALRYAVPTLMELRQQGVIGAVGAGDGNADTLTRFVAESDIDVVLEAGRYTLLDRTAANALLPACREGRASVIAAGVFNTGLLATSNPQPGARFEYVEAEAASVTAAQTMAKICREHDIELPAAAVQFPFRDPAVSAVLVGAETPAQVEQAVNHLNVAIPDALWDDLSTAV